MTALVVRNLQRRFRLKGGHRLHAVDDVSFSVARGGSLGLVGESGSGKSTLARLLTGLDRADGGTVEIADGAASVQFVFQSAEDALNPAFTLGRNIAVGQGRSRPADTGAVVDAARAVGLDPELLGRRPHQVSGGQQARAGIARALVAGPRLLVLDEPTAALDVSVQAAVLKLIDRLRRDRGLTIVFISHDLEVVRLMCDEVMVLYLGRVAEMGPAGRISTTPAHPYTRALLDATPGRSGGAPGPGEALSPVDPPENACLFHNRCPRASELCWSVRPQMRSFGEGWRAACHHPLSEPAE